MTASQFWKVLMRSPGDVNDKVPENGHAFGLELPCSFESFGSNR
jgi:hypothetical protein